MHSKVVLTYSGLIKILVVSTVQHENNPVSVTSVCFPQRTYFLLTTNIPDQEGGPSGAANAALDPLTVEANGGNSVEILVQLHHVQGCGLASSVQAYHDHVDILATAFQGKCIQ